MAPETRYSGNQADQRPRREDVGSECANMHTTFIPDVAPETLDVETRPAAPMFGPDMEPASVSGAYVFISRVGHFCYWHS